MRRLLVIALVFAACTTPAPPPPMPSPAPQPSTTTPPSEASIGNVRVTASTLNVRKEGSANADVIAQVKKGDRLILLKDDDQWVRVRLADGTIGFVSAPLVRREGAAAKSRRGCPADTDFSFAKAPMPSFSDRTTAHGIVSVDATVDVKGTVTATKITSNTTGDETLGFLTEREIKNAKFVAPIRNCVARAFIFTYTRTF